MWTETESVGLTASLSVVPSGGDCDLSCTSGKRHLSSPQQYINACSQHINWTELQREQVVQPATRHDDASIDTRVSTKTIIIIIIITTTMFTVLSSWPKSLREFTRGSFDKCRLSAGWPPTPRPSQSTWAVRPPKIGYYRPYPTSPLLLLLSQ